MNGRQREHDERSAPPAEEIEREQEVDRVAEAQRRGDEPRRAGDQTPKTERGAQPCPEARDCLPLATDARGTIGVAAAAARAMRELVIDGTRITDDGDCYVIAEIGHNHQGSVEPAQQLFVAALTVA